MKFNKKIIGMFLGLVMVSAFGVVANAQIKTTHIDLKISNNEKVSDVAKILAAVTKEDVFLKNQGIKMDNITCSNMLLGAGSLEFMAKNGDVMPLYSDYSDKIEIQVKNDEKIKNGVISGEINEIEINEEDIEKSRAKLIERMKAKLEEMEEDVKYYNDNVEKGIDFEKAGKELLDKKIEIALRHGIDKKRIDALKLFLNNNEESLRDFAKSTLNKTTIDSYNNNYIKDIKENINRVKNVSVEEIKKAQKDVKFINAADDTRYDEHSEMDSMYMEKLEEAMELVEK